MTTVNATNARKGLVGTMLVVKKIIDSLFPVMNLPDDTDTQRKIVSEYFRKSKAAGFGIWIMVFVVVLVVSFIIGTMPNLFLGQKMLFILPVCLCYLLSLFFYIYAENRYTFKAMKFERISAIVLLLAMSTAIGNIMLAYCIKDVLLITDDTYIMLMILICYIYYILCYFIGYRLLYKKMIQSILSKEENKNSNSGMIYLPAIGGWFLSQAAYTYRILPLPVLFIILFLLISYIFAGLSVMLVSYKMFCVLYKRKQELEEADNTINL